MTTDNARGFTIIEVMLFLAITGGLFALLMVGVNIGITQQRYLDSVRSYKALLQNQYAEVLTTRNEGSDSLKCSRSNDGTVDETGDPVSRGTSKCVILGRAVQINGSKITLSSVTGFDPVATDIDSNANGERDASEIDNSDDITALKLYRPKIASFDKQETEVDWGGNLVRPGGNDSTAVIILLRSPATGVIKVFTSQNGLENSIDLSAMVDQANTASGAIIGMCVTGESGLLPKQLVSIDPRIAGPDAVGTDGGESGQC